MVFIRFFLECSDVCGIGRQSIQNGDSNFLHFHHKNLQEQISDDDDNLVFIL